MQTFLEQAAQHIYQQHQLNELKNICVVLPTRRATFFFKQTLAQLSDLPFLAPKVYSVDDFVTEMSGVKLIDSISIIFELYEVFKKYDVNVDFNKFLAWSPTLLKDFDTIDQYLVEKPKALFEYMSEAKAIERWMLDLPENKTLTLTTTTDTYFKLFENLSLVYQDLQERLLAKGLAYRGMAYRILASNIETQLLGENSIEKYYFVGLNALSSSEEKIIATLIKAQKAETLWDSDDYYMKQRNKAGQVLRRYKDRAIFGKWNWQSNDLLTTEKEIRVFASPNNTLQAKIAGEIYADELLSNPKQQTVMVLSDEALLHPLMFSLDKHIEDFNITMGLSLKSSMLATLIESLFDLQQNVVEFKGKSGETFKIPKFSHRHISKVLNHPFIRRYELIKYESKEIGDKTENPIRGFLKHITKNNLVYLGKDDFLEYGKNEPLFGIIFERWGDNAHQAIKSLHRFVDILREVYKESNDAIETEYLFLFYTILNRLEGIIKQNPINLKTFKHFLYELIRQEKIPFSGEPVADLQIMSMLETRCLDFEHVIILSLNEGKLPSAKRNNSMIPFDACVEYNLPVYSDQDGVMAYHFFRLFQRAKKIDLIYAEPMGEGLGGSSGEKSRFILQVEHELAKQNKNIKISHPQIRFTNQELNSIDHSIAIYKTEDIQATIKQFLAEKGIYPSHLTQYLRCSLQFYFNKIVNVSKKEEIEEKFEANIFGNWLHKTLENIDKKFIEEKRLITKPDIEKVIKDVPKYLNEAYLQLFGGYVIDTGINYIYGHIAEKLLIDFFKMQLEVQVFPMEVIDVEKQLSIENKMFVNGELLDVKIAGRIDRIEKVNNTQVLVDYKTGRVTGKDLDMKNLEEQLLIPANDKLRQLWFYQYLMTKELIEKGTDNTTDVSTKIYSFRNLNENLERKVEFTKGESKADFVENSEKIINGFLSDLLNNQEPFVQTTDINICKYCDFIGICGR